MKTHPLNLAIFRIVLFGTLIGIVQWVDPVWFSHIPHELIRIPSRLKLIAPHVPLDPGLVKIATWLLLAACVSGMVGFYSRTSAFLALMLGIYVLGVPNLFGKLHHYHHLIWLTAILAASPSGDALSVDAARRAVRNADRGRIDPPEAGDIYGLSIVFIILILGSVYFFPGLWKVWKNGPEWFLSDNLKWHLHRKWVEIGFWEPFFRIDHYPLLYRGFGFATVVFELTFVFWALWPRTRPWIALAGLGFHQGTRLFMCIPFWDLQSCYVVFFNWESLFKKAGRFLFPAPMHLIYDAHCQLCRRAAAVLGTLDVMGRVVYVSAQDREVLKAAGLGGLDPEALLKDIHAAAGPKTWKGFEAYRALAWRIPLLWPALPFLYLWPVPAIGQRIYRHVADSRTCALPSAPIGMASEKAESGRLQKSVLIAAGSFLLLMNAYFGIKDIHSWPFTVFPTFEAMLGGSESATLIFEAWGPQGEKLGVEESYFRKKLSNSRWQVFKTNALQEAGKGPERLERYLKAFWRFVASQDPEAAKAVRVVFYKARVTGDPDRKSENPVSKEFLYELAVTK